MNDTPYVMLDKKIIENPALSFSAKSILAYLLSRPENWDVDIIADLCEHSTDDEDTVRSCIHELQNAGYVVFDQNSGQIEVRECPI